MNNSPDHTKDLAQSWISNAQKWTAAIRSGRLESRRLVTDKAIVEAVLAHQPQRVLDIGCGEGWLIRALEKHGIEGVGVDGSPDLIEAAQSAGSGTFHACTYAEFIDGPDNIGHDFDIVLANFSILQEEVTGLLQAIRRSLAKRGKLIFQTVHPWSAGGVYCDGWREEDFRSFEGDWEPMPWYFRTLGSWVGLLHECGYNIVELVEPSHPDTDVPMSLLVIAAPK